MPDPMVIVIISLADDPGSDRLHIPVHLEWEDILKAIDIYQRVVQGEIEDRLFIPPSR